MTVVQPMRVREVTDEAERARLWTLAVAAFPPYEEYQTKTTRQDPALRRGAGALAGRARRRSGLTSRGRPLHPGLDHEPG